MSCGCVTTVADTSCTVDVQAYRLDKLGGISADLCMTAAQAINNTTLSYKLFAFNPATFVPGDVLDVRVANRMQRRSDRYGSHPNNCQF